MPSRSKTTSPFADEFSAERRVTMTMNVMTRTAMGVVDNARRRQPPAERDQSSKAAENAQSGKQRGCKDKVQQFAELSSPPPPQSAQSVAE